MANLNLQMDHAPVILTHMDISQHQYTVNPRQTTSTQQYNKLLLVPKLRPPRLQTALVVREQLLARLDAALECKLTLLSAPAGFGKTTLVSQWITKHKNQPEAPVVAWVSLDPDDNDPLRFWYYVMMACQEFQTHSDSPAFTQLQPLPQFAPDAIFLETVLTALLNELASWTHTGVLVLEDYHVITDPQLHTTMTFFLDHLPPTLHVIVITRQEPAFPLTRWRARNDLTELYATDLRFSLEETQTFYQQAITFQLSPKEITQLDTQVEGWVTGLRLIALLLQRQLPQQEIAQLLKTVSGRHRHILDYFVTEVLHAQPEALQVFILNTSILSRLTGSLCDAISGLNDSAAQLEALVQANLFLLPLDGDGQWYRYHTLFAEAMQREAERSLGNEALKENYKKASQWYAQHAMYYEAIEAAFHAQDDLPAALLIEQFMGERHHQHAIDHKTLRRWLEKLPQGILEQHPALCFRLALILLFSEDCQGPLSTNPAEQTLQIAQHYWEAENNREKLGEVWALQSLMLNFQGNKQLAMQQAQKALSWLPEHEHQWRGTSLTILGDEQLKAGHVLQAQQIFTKARFHFEHDSNQYATRAGLLILANLCIIQGELQQAAELYKSVLTTAGNDISDKGKATLGLARLHYAWNTLVQAERDAQEAYAIGKRLSDEVLQAHAILLLAEIKHAQGQTNQARHSLYQLLTRALLQKPALHQEILLQQAKLQLAAGNLAAAQNWATARAQHGAISRLQQEQEELIVARLLIAQGKPDEALPILESWQNESQKYGQVRNTAEILVIKALAYNKLAKQALACQALREALLLTYIEKHQRIFLDEGKEIIALLHTILPDTHEEALRTHIRTLLQEFSQQQIEQRIAPAEQLALAVKNTEALSPQEQRVLHLLVDGYSNPEIAETMVVSINTVKTQVRSIFRKLNVNSRKEARNVIKNQRQS